MLISSLCFASMSAMAKDLSEKFSSVQLVFFRSAVGLPFLFTSLWLKPAIQKGGKLYFIIFADLKFYLFQVSEKADLCVQHNPYLLELVELFFEE